MTRTLGSWWACLLVGSTCLAGVMRHDVPEADYLTFANSAAFRSSVMIDFNSGNIRSGTLIGSNWVLTAAHAFANGATPGQFVIYVDGDPYSVDFVVKNPGWQNIGNITNGYDTALLRLSSHVLDVTPAPITSRIDLIGREAVYVGFGQGGTGIDPPTSGSPFGTKRAGTNIIEGFLMTQDTTPPFEDPRPDFLVADFDNAITLETPVPLGTLGSPIPTALEILTAPGDSGGGVFVDFGDGNGYQLVGVHSQVRKPVMDPPLLDFGYGSYAVSQWLSPGEIAWIYSVTGIPEPSTYALLGVSLGLGGLAFRNWKRGRKSTA